MIICFVLNEVFVDPHFGSILLNYSSPSFLPYPRGQRSVLHLALTCRAFCEPALNVLWSHLRSTRPLVESLPDEVVLSRAPSPEQFRPLALRAARVQTLYNGDSPVSDPAYPFFHASVPTDGQLFPKLRSLAWYDTRPASIPTLTLLLPTLNTLLLEISKPSFFKAVIPGLRTAAPRLKALELVLANSPLVEDGRFEIESLLLSYPDGLIELSIRFCDISNSLLDAIAGWPRLRWLTFHTSFKIMPTVHIHTLQPFQALITLHVSCEGLSFFASFLRAVLRMDSDDTCCFACPNLKRINIHAHRCSPPSIWSEILSFLTFTTLEQITLIESCHDCFAPPCHVPLSFDFRPFLARPTALADLKTLNIRPVHSITITHDDILTLARTCPHLQVLRLGLHNTPVSLYALAYLVGRCRELREVTLCIDARLDALGTSPLNNDDQVGLQPNMALIYLNVGVSPIACVGPLHSPTAPDLVRSIPRFLHMIAPRLAGVRKTFGLPTTDWMRPRQYDQDAENRWIEVSVVLLKMVQSG